MEIKQLTPAEQKKCLTCKEVFTKRKGLSSKEWSVRKYCSQLCHARSPEFRKMVGGLFRGEKNRLWKGGWKNNLPSCTDCGRKLKTINSKRCHPCSLKCLERRTKISESHKGNKAYQWKGGWMNKLKCIDCGCQLRKQGAKRCKSCWGKTVAGSKNSRWMGGVTPINVQIRKSKEYKLWRTAVFERDNYTCIWCGEKSGKIEADHIKPFCDYPELRFAIDNGRTLCHDCHKKTETYGYRKNGH